MSLPLREVTPPFLSIENLSRYHDAPRFPWPFSARRNRHAIFANLSLSLRQGETVGLVGVSGCGKSTLLNTLLALSPADSGHIFCDGQPVRPGSVRSLRWYRRKVQMIVQDPGGSLDPRQSIAALLAEPLKRLQIEENVGKRVAEVMQQVELSAGLLYRQAGTLSGGQAQRVAIARALIVRPDFLLADEPVSSLDLPLQAQIKTLLQRITHENGTGLLMVSHDMSMLHGLCDRLLVMHQGRIVEDGPTSAVLTSARHPHTRELLQAMPTLPTF